MDYSLLMSFIVVAALLVVSPGPNGLLIAKTVSLSGKPAGFANIAGFVVAFFLHGSLSILGISIILMQSAQLFLVFKLLGAAYLCWIGLKALCSAFKDTKDNTRETSRLKTNAPVSVLSFKGAFLEGFLTNALNPKVCMFYLAAFPQFMPVNSEPAYAFVLVALHACLNTLWFGVMVFLIGRVKWWGTNTALARWLKAATGAIFIGFGVKLASLKP